MRFGPLFAFGSLVVLIAACGGAVSESNGNGGGGGGGGDGGGGGGGGGGGEGGGGEGGGECTSATFPGDRACVPGTARANTPLEIGIAATEGCLGCFTTFEPCRVDVSGTNIKVAMRTLTCEPPGDRACPAVCLLPQARCTLPPLAAGTYTLEVEGETPPVARPPRTLVVSDDATATSCALPLNGEKAKPLDGTKYSTSCSVDADCALATVGDVCAPCSCPNLAIAASSSASYAADYRARTSECLPGDGAIACAACAPVKAVCDVDAGLTGTCVIQPGF